MIKLMDKYSIIKLKEQGKSNRAVAELLGINRKTVARYWNSYLRETEKLQIADVDVKQTQEVIVSNPKYDSKNRSKRKYTILIDEALELILDGEAVKAKLLGTNKQQLSVVQIHEELLNQGFDIGKTTISEKVREKRQRFQECFIKQDYDYGDRLEYDFGEVKLIINNVATKYHIAVLSSPASNFRWAYLYKNQKKEVFFDSHVRFFEMMKGSYKEVVYDNMRNVVTRFIGKHEKQLNEELIKLSIYYGFTINVTNCYKGNEKGTVERAVEYVRRKAFSVNDEFDSLEDANVHLHSTIKKLNDKPTKYLGNVSSTDKLVDEKDKLIKVIADYVICTDLECRVDKYSTVTIEQNRYSVSELLVGRFVKAKVYPERIDIYYENKLITSHIRSYKFSYWTIDINHYLSTFKKKPGALHNSTAMQNCSHRIKKIYHSYYTKNPREFIGLIELIKTTTIEDVEKAIVELEILGHRHVTTDKIKNIVTQENNTIQDNIIDTDDEIVTSSLSLLNMLSQAVQGGIVN